MVEDDVAWAGQMETRVQMNVQWRSGHADDIADLQFNNLQSAVQSK